MLVSNQVGGDDEAAEPCDQSTWERATDFLRALAEEARASAGVTLPVPHILPGPAGGIDLHWQLTQFELLLNFPPGLKPATFYGDDRLSTSVRGTIDPLGRQARSVLLPWLVPVDR